ncbi:hypothetical protein SAMN04488109_5553 [Chryseolinea serpens]|jgi:hypothetical protein|uniref:DUF5777 domain-containing protein n=1 Tax=Chryseolinea serpens TaxID=947013 RepID=A0A1M5W0R7_9BACT|nr:DUF5777 family beta-barrel protein [Chryseolinea serpens]SHH80804.1 hypothetical protein SAMN04488109_5553 [Chryseolinea serpens]
MKKIILLFLLIPCVALAQNDLLGELEKDSKKETEVVYATFKGTRLGNGHTIETKPGGTLEFIFGHRFGAINGGSYEMWGLDQAYVRLGLDYGITDRLSASIGRNSTDKTMDGYLKYKLLRQTSGVKNFPISVTALGGIAYKLSPKDNSEVAPGFENIDRLSYTGQLLIARKFSTAFSFQLMPTLVHKNYVTQSIESNDQFAIGFGGRIKLSKSIALTGEYYYNVSRISGSPYYDAMSLGIDIETGGHVFQLLLTNAIGLTERAFITETRDNFWDGGIHLGFNVTRAFQLKKRQ